MRTSLSLLGTLIMAGSRPREDPDVEDFHRRFDLLDSVYSQTKRRAAAVVAEGRRTMRWKERLPGRPGEAGARILEVSLKRRAIR